MPEIKFTQYMRPDGHPIEAFIDRPQAVFDKAEQIIDAGYVFESEHLMTGNVSVTISDPDKEEDLAIRIISNGPEVIEAIDDMINSFDIK